MKITCQSCQAKYTIADEKVVGKTVKIKCKKCGATIVVHGNEIAAGAPASQPAPAMAAAGGGDDEQEGETRVFGGDGGPGASDEWTVNVTDDDQRTMTSAQIVAEYLKGAVSGDSYVWKDGMADWLPLSSVPELMELVSKGSPSSRPAPRPSSGPKSEAPLAAAAGAKPAAARKPGRAPAIDLFGTNNEMPSSLPSAGAAGISAAAANASADRLVGERNENSVLFSLSALTAAENAARSAPAPTKSEDAVISFLPSPTAKPSNGGRAGIDDIMNLGGGINAAPILAPPPLLTPYVEPPPPPQPIAPAPVSAGPPPSGSPMMVAPSYAAPQKKTPVGLIAGLGVGIVAIIGVAVFFLTRAPAPGPVATNDQSTANAAQTTPPPATQTAAPTDAPAPPPADTSTSTAATSTTSAATSKPTAVAGNVPGKPNDKPNTPTDKPTSTPTAAPTPDKPPPPADTGAAPAAGGGKEFDRGAAVSALSAAAGAARSCKKPDGPTGSGKVKVTFAPSGRVTTAEVQGAPFAGTPVGGCIASAFRSAKVPPFDGSPVSTTKSFTIN